MLRRTFPVFIVIVIILVIGGATIKCLTPSHSDFFRFQDRLKEGLMSRAEVFAMFGPPTWQTNLGESNIISHAKDYPLFGSFDARCVNVLVYEHPVQYKTRSGRYGVVNEFIGLDQKEMVCAYGNYVDWK